MVRGDQADAQDATYGVPVMMSFFFSWDCVGTVPGRRKKRIMTVMFSKSFIIAFLDNFSRGSALSPHRRLALAQMHFHFLLYDNLRHLRAFRQKWMDGFFSAFFSTHATRESWEDMALSFYFFHHDIVSLQNGGMGGELMAYGSAPDHSEARGMG